MRITELIEGSVRRAVDFVRVNVQLEQAESGGELGRTDSTPIWDFSAVQDEAVGQIV